MASRIIDAKDSKVFHTQLVYFMTNRAYNHAYATTKDLEQAYLPQQRVPVDSTDPDSAFDCGCIKVQIPESHKRGDSAKSLQMKVYEKAKDKNAFFESILDSLEAKTDGEVVLFIHGFNVSWRSAIKKAAQLTWDTSRASAPGAAKDPRVYHDKRIALAFDWASVGSPFNYAFTPYDNDRGRIDDAQDHLPRLLQLLEELMVRDLEEAEGRLASSLEKLASDPDYGLCLPGRFLREDLLQLLELQKGASSSSGAPQPAVVKKQLLEQDRRFKALHIVAHSMGNLVLQRGLSNAVLSDRVEATRDGMKCKPHTGADMLRELVNGGVRTTITFAAPDVDHASMNIMLNNLNFLCPCNLYCSRNDLPLKASTGLARILGNDLKGRAGAYSWGFGGRAGRKNHSWHVYLHPVTKTIKLNRTQGHGYFAKDEEILQDISAIMAGKDVDERNIEAIDADSTHCLSCSDRINTLMRSAGPTMFKLKPRVAPPAEQPQSSAAGQLAQSADAALAPQSAATPSAARSSTLTICVPTGGGAAAAAAGGHRSETAPDAVPSTAADVDWPKQKQVQKHSGQESAVASDAP